MMSKSYIAYLSFARLGVRNAISQEYLRMLLRTLNRNALYLDTQL